MSINSYVIKNEELKNLFTHFFGDSVVNAYVAVNADDDFDLDFLRVESERLSEEYSKITQTMVVDSKYEIVLEFRGLKYVEITMAAPDSPMMFSKYAFGHSIPVDLNK